MTGPESGLRGDEVIVVTGASRGIGRALVEHYATQGLRVAACSRTSPEVQVDGVLHAAVDVTDERAVRDFFSTVRRSYGRIDGLIHAAGIYAAQYSMIMSAATASQVLTTNVLGAFLCAREAAKIMKAQSSGRIVSLSSIAVALAAPGTAIYSASKAALEQLMRVLAREYEAFGIRVNTLSLSVVDGVGMAQLLSPSAIDDAIRSTSSARTLQIAEVMQAVDALLDPTVATGETIRLGGF